MNIFSTKRTRVIKSMALAVGLVLGIQSGYAQVYHINENFTGGSGTTPPSGWSQNRIAGATTDNWDFNNTGGRSITAPMAGKVASFDSDN